jgi:hypothetical protein
LSVPTATFAGVTFDSGVGDGGEHCNKHGDNDFGFHGFGFMVFDRRVITPLAISYATESPGIALL